MALDIDITTLKTIQVDETTGISVVTADITSDGGKTFQKITFRYNPAMSETDIMKVVQAEHDRLDGTLTHAEVVSRIASTLVNRGKTFDRGVPVSTSDDDAGTGGAL
jgi:hypothetical protein